MATNASVKKVIPSQENKVSNKIALQDDDVVINLKGAPFALIKAVYDQRVNTWLKKYGKQGMTLDEAQESINERCFDSRTARTIGDALSHLSDEDVVSLSQDDKKAYALMSSKCAGYTGSCHRARSLYLRDILYENLKDVADRASRKPFTWEESDEEEKPDRVELITRQIIGMLRKAYPPKH